STARAYSCNLPLARPILLADCTNPDAPMQPSLGALVAQCAINGRVVKALNTVDARVVSARDLTLRPAVPLCGDDDDACDTTAERSEEHTSEVQSRENLVC